VIDVVLGAGVFEGVRPNELSSLQGGLMSWLSWRYGGKRKTFDWLRSQQQL
jgi:hypothetical protein